MALTEAEELELLELEAEAAATVKAPAAKPVQESKKQPFEVIYPRTKEALADVEKGKYKSTAAATPRTTGALLSDALSAPGRAIASLPALMPGGEKFSEAMMRTRGKERTGLAGNVAQVAGDIVRSPATALGGIAGGAVKGAATRALGAAGSKIAPILSRVAGNVAEGLPYLAGRQVERVGEGRGISGVEAGLDVATDVAIPIGGMALKKAIKPARKAINEAIGNAMKAAAEKIEMATIKPSKKLVKDGFDVKNVFKHRIEGGLEESTKKLDARFADLTQQLNARLKAADETGQPIVLELKDVFETASNELMQTKAKTFGSNTRIKDAMEYMLSEIETVAPDGVVDLATANEIKRGLGRIGSWEYGRYDPDATAREAVANLFYSKLKQEIENKAPEGVKEINKQLSELIPIEKAIIERIPVKQRNDMISLTDVIGTTGALMAGPKGWGLVILNRLSKSPTFGAGLYRTGEGIAKEGVTKTAIKGVPSIAASLAKSKIGQATAGAGIGAGIGAANAPEGKGWEYGLAGAGIGALGGIGAGAAIKKAVESGRGLAGDVLSKPKTKPVTPISGRVEPGSIDLAAGLEDAPVEDAVQKAIRKIEPAKTVEQADDQQAFFNRVKSDLWKKITNKTDRDILAGRALKDKKGNLLQLSDKAKDELQRMVDGINENSEWHFEMQNIGVPLPEHIDDVRGWIQEVMGK